MEWVQIFSTLDMPHELEEEVRDNFDDSADEYERWCTNDHWIGAGKELKEKLNKWLAKNGCVFWPEDEHHYVLIRIES
jgi:hypothetical protein